MEIKAYARYIRMAPRKVRLVTNLVKGMQVDKAISDLRFLRRDAAVPVRKLIESAAANATHNGKLERSALSILKITADGGPTLKRWRPRAFGRAAPIRKRTTHIAVVLTDEPQKSAKEKKQRSVKIQKQESKKTENIKVNVG